MLEYDPKDAKAYEERGKLFAVISVYKSDKGSQELERHSTKNDVEKLFTGREILSKLTELYYDEQAGSTLRALKVAVRGAQDEFSSFSKVEIAAMSQVGDVAYLVCLNGSSVHIYRNGVLTEILKSRQGLLVSASGHIKDNDVFTLGTESFLKLFSKDSIVQELKKGIANAIDMFTTQIHSGNGVSNLGVLLVEFSKDEASDNLVNTQRIGTQEEKKVKTIEKTTSGLESESFGKVPGKAKKMISGLSLSLPRKGLSVQRQEDAQKKQRKKVSLSVGALLILLLVVSMVFGIRQKKEKDFKESYQSKLDSAQHEINEAKDIYTINPSRARELLITAQNKVLGLETEGVVDPSISELKDEIDQVEADILGVYKSDPQLYLDLSLLTSDFSGDLMSTSDGKVFILDKQSEKVVGIQIDSKRTEVVAGPNQIKEPQDIASYADKAFILNDKGVFEVGDNFDKAIEKEWEGNVLTYAYAGNFYVLNKNDSTIRRHQGVKSGYSSGSDWLYSGVAVDLKDAKSWVIDGSIWVLTNAGNILKFNFGNLQSFKVKDVFPELVSAKAIYTNEELEFLYILDSENARVVVTDKDGNYKAQYVSDGIRDSRDLTVSEKDKKILLLVGEKLMVIEIRH